MDRMNLVLNLLKYDKMKVSNQMFPFTAHNGTVRSHDFSPSAGKQIHARRGKQRGILLIV